MKKRKNKSHRHGIVLAAVALLLVGFAVTANQHLGAFDSLGPRSPVSPASVQTTEGSSKSTQIVVMPDVDAKLVNGKAIVMWVYTTDGQTRLSLSEYPEPYPENPNVPNRYLRIKATAVDGEWYTQYQTSSIAEPQSGMLHRGYTGIDVGAMNDGEIEGDHDSTIYVGYDCSTDLSQFPKHNIRAEVVNHITDNDTEESINGTTRKNEYSFTPCILDNDDWDELPNGGETVANQGTQDEQKSTLTALADSQILNELAGYTSGAGETVWLFPTEGVRFLLGGQGDEELDMHSITVTDVNDERVAFVVASDPIEGQLAKNEEKKYDVNKDGKDDVSVKFVGTLDGQAGLLVKPVSPDKTVSLAPTDRKKDDVTSKPTSKASNLPWIIAGSAGIVVVLAVVTTGLLIKRGKLPRLRHVLMLLSRGSRRSKK